jgi:hypothetical protein
MKNFFREKQKEPKASHQSNQKLMITEKKFKASGEEKTLRKGGANNVEMQIRSASDQSINRVSF